MKQGMKVIAFYSIMLAAIFYFADVRAPQAQQSYDSIRVIRAYAADFTGWNHVLPIGTMGYELDTRKFKLGDGNTAWTSLSYVNVAPGSDGLATQAQISGLRTTDTPTFAGINSSSTVTATLISATSVTTGRALCLKAGGILGYCSVVTAATGTCTCN